MSKVDIIFRSVENLIHLLYMKHFDDDMPDDFVKTLGTLLMKFDSDTTMKLTINIVLEFRNKWAHSTYDDSPQINAAIDLIGMHLGAEKDKMLTMNIMLTKELVKDLNYEHENERI
jgi:hypothetical protein